MIIIKLPSSILGLEFKHIRTCLSAQPPYRELSDEDVEAGVDFHPVRATHLDIYRFTPDGELSSELMFLGYGRSVCAPGDNFSKATGRKRALIRGLSGLNLTRAERTLVWEQFRKQVSLT